MLMLPLKSLLSMQQEDIILLWHLVSSVPAVADHISLLKDIQNKTKAAMSMAAETMKRYYDHFVQDAPDIEVGDRVWLDAQNVTTTAPTKKLTDCRLDPYEVTEKVSELDYRLRLPSTLKKSTLSSMLPYTIPSLMIPFQVVHLHHHHQLKLKVKRSMRLKKF